METFEDRIAKEIKVDFCRRVIPSDIFRFLPCLTTQDIEKVHAVERREGPLKAAENLHQRLIRRPNWLQQLVEALVVPDVGLEDFGEELRKKCEQKSDPQKESGNEKPGDDIVVQKDPAVILREIIIASRQDKIASEIKVEFCRRVIPSDLIRYLPCLTQLDTEKVQAEENNNGPMMAAQLLHSRLIRRPDWLHELTEALLDQDVGLTDFGQRVDEKQRQLTVVVDAPGACLDGLHCGEEHPFGSELALSSGESQIVQAESDIPLEKEDNDEIKRRIKLMIFDRLLKDVKDSKDLPEIVSLGEQLCTRIDKIVHKCIEITFRMTTVEKLEAFWELYKTGGLARAFSRDILTPERRQQMMEDAKTEGVELNESDFSLQVYIDEKDYMFVKEFLTNRNAPLLAKTTVESVLLHGRENPQYTQEEKNNKMRTFRRILPDQLQMVLNDPFVQTFLPEYFSELAKHDTFEAVRLLHRIVMEKLQQLLSSPLAFQLSNIANIIAGTDDLECSFVVEDDKVLISSSDHTWSVPKEMWSPCLNFFRVNIDKIQFSSELVLAIFALNDEKNLYEKAQNIAKLQFFAFAAVLFYTNKPYKLISIIEGCKLPHKYLVEYMYLRWLFTNNLSIDQFEKTKTPSLVLPLTKDIRLFLRNALAADYSLQLLLHLPLDYQIKDVGSEIVFETTSESLNKSLPPILLQCATLSESESNVIDIRSERSTEKEISLFGSTENTFSYMLSIAKLVNTLGSGYVNVTIADSQYKKGAIAAYVIHFYILPRRRPTKHKQHKEKLDCLVEIESVGHLTMNFASYPINDKDIALLADAFHDGLELNQINLTETGLTGIQLFRICEFAITANITQLILSDNELKFDESTNESGLGNLVSLEVLEMRNCQLKDTGVKMLKKEILALKKLRGVDFSKNSLTANGLVVLCTALRSSIGIRALRIHENKYGQSGGYILAMFLENLEFLEILNICYCDFGDVGITAIAEALKAKNIKKINIRSNHIKQRGTSALLKCFKECRHLNHFEYGENDIGFSQGLRQAMSDDVGKLFLEMLDSCKQSMEYLGLWKCGLGNTSILKDPGVLLELTELQEIVLQANDLEDSHAESIGASLHAMENLQSIILRSNEIGPEGGRHLARGIEKCPSLQNIILDRNKINDIEVLQHIVEVAVKSLKNLQNLDISYNMEMFSIAREHPKHKELMSSLQNLLPDAVVKEDELLTRIESGNIVILI